MSETRKDLPGRLLRLLSLLQGRREWSGAELAERLGVTDRTLRRDVGRLRALDYPVESTTGTAGGYRLISGRNLPPLLLDDDEAIAVALGLATAAGGSVAGLEESSTRALAKLEQVLPARLRPRLAALSDATVAVPRPDVPRADPAVLAVIAGCRRDHEMLSFDYRNRSDQVGARRVEPHHLVTLQGRWYLIAYDPERADWRTFRVDRMERPTPAHRRFAPRDLPAPDPAAYLARVFAGASYRHTARMTVRLSADAVRAGVFASIPGEVEDRGADGCAIRLSAESADLVVQYVAAIAALGAEFTLDAAPEIAERVRALGRRLEEESTSPLS
ncbi:helix-turn-helix transcriptional regulator [Actinoallomurus sp. CA-150999]|uniref:helix-turn-helix transcriptional regulator n=1 Tax=Actinoallomurus sp. CA-150999 TaxID=3239887 RepID=UPI003D94A445